MNPLDAKEWFLFGSGVVVWVFSSGMIWARLNSRIDSGKERLDAMEKDHEMELAKLASLEQLNGFGLRVTGAERACSEHAGRMDRFEKELSEYRADAKSNNIALARIEKAVADQTEAVNQGNLVTGSRMAEIAKSIVAMDKNLGNRLTRVETVQKIEQKIGPLPTE